MSSIHDTQQPGLRATTVALVVLAAVFVVLRFCSRRRKGLSLGIDDFTILVSLALLVADGGFNMALIHYGMGLHAVTLQPENLVMISKVLVAYECVYATTVGVIKISILLMYARIFPTREFRIAALVLGGITVSWVIAIVFVSIFQCTPVQKTWNSTLPGHCINLKGSFVGNAIPNIITDVAILSLPVRVVWGLHASLYQRVSVLVVFLTGSFVVFASIYRFTTLFKFRATDTSWTLSTACTWCIVECSCGIISACLPTLRPLLVMVSPVFGSRSKSSNELRTRTGDEHGNAISLNKSAFRPAQERLWDSQFRAEANKKDTAGSDDEVPLNQIVVRKDMTWAETQCAEEQ